MGCVRRKEPFMPDVFSKPRQRGPTEGVNALLFTDERLRSFDKLRMTKERSGRLGDPSPPLSLRLCQIRHWVCRGSTACGVSRTRLRLTRLCGHISKKTPKKVLTAMGESCISTGGRSARHNQGGLENECCSGLEHGAFVCVSSG